MLWSSSLLWEEGVPDLGSRGPSHRRGLNAHVSRPLGGLSSSCLEEGFEGEEGHGHVQGVVSRP